MNFIIGALFRYTPRFLGVVGISAVMALCMRWALNTQYERGFADARAQCQQAVVDDYERLLRESADVIASAHAQSQTINRALAERQRASAKTVKDLRDALSATQTDRVDCVFDADSVRHVEAARERAARSVVTGIGRDTGDIADTLPAAGGDDE